MPFVPVANTAEVEIRMTANGQKVENTLWFEFATPPAVSDLLALVNAIESWWLSDYAPRVSVGVQLREIAATSMDSATGPQVTQAPVSPSFGGNTANIVPGNVTITVSFRTGSRGRSFRGRNYIVGLTEDQIAGNQVVAGVTAPWAAAYNNLIAAVAVANATWVIASRFSGVNPTTKQPIPRAAGITSPVLSAVIVDDNIDSQRRRLTGRGQ